MFFRKSKIGGSEYSMSSVIQKFLVICCLMIIGVLGVINICTHISLYFTIIYIILIIVFTYILYILNKYEKKYKIPFWIVVVIVSTVMKLISIIVLNTPPTSDFITLLNAAKLVTKGQYSVFSDWYFYNWAYQTPFVLYESLILKVFQHDFMLEIFNVIFSMGTCILTYKIASLIFSKKVSTIVLMLIAFYPYEIIYCNILTNQFIATFFWYLGIYILLKTDIKQINAKRLVIIGTIFAISNLMRPEIPVLIVTLTICIILKLFDKKFIERKNFILNIVVGFTTYIVLGLLVSAAISGFNINSEGTRNNCPEWKFICGLNKDTSGGYSDENFNILYFDQDTKTKESRKLIMKNLQSFDGLDDFIKFEILKNAKMWASSDPFYLITSYLNTDIQFINKLKVGEAINIYVKFNTAYYTFVWILVLVSILFCFRKSSQNKYSVLLIFMFTINVLVYCIIEQQARYRLNMMPVLFLLTGFAFEKIESRILK